MCSAMLGWMKRFVGPSCVAVVAVVFLRLRSTVPLLPWMSLSVSLAGQVGLVSSRCFRGRLGEFVSLSGTVQ